MSRTLLAKRLRSLERSGIVSRMPNPKGRGWHYYLTPAGQELADICLTLGTWGARWLEVVPAEHSDPFVVLWAWKNAVAQKRLPRKRVVVRFDLKDRPKERFWLLLDREDVELCVKDPAYDEDLVIATDCETLMYVHMGTLPLAEAMRRGLWDMAGPGDLVRAFPKWGGLSRFAGIRPVRAGAAG